MTPIERAICESGILASVRYTDAIIAIANFISSGYPNEDAFVNAVGGVESAVKILSSFLIISFRQY